MTALVTRRIAKREFIAEDDPVKNRRKIPTEQVELEAKVEELRRSREELEASRNKYAFLYDFAPVGYFTFDREGVIRSVNLTGVRLLGV